MRPATWTPEVRPATWWTCARINALHWSAIGALAGLVLTGWARVRSS